MKLRTIALAVAVLGALALVVTFVNRPPTAAAVADARLGQPVLARATADQTAALRLSADGKTVELKKSPTGQWLVASYHDFPADLDKLSRFVRSLADTKVESFISAAPATVARLGFKDTSVRLLDPAGQTLLDLELGKPADNRPGRYFRLAGDARAYLAPFESFLDTEPKNWADTTLLALTPDDIAKVELTLPVPPAAAGSVPILLVAESVVAERASKDTPFVAPGPGGRPLKPGVITALLGNLASLRFTDTAEPDAPLALAAKATTRTVKLTTFGGKTATIALGRKPEEKKPKPAAAAPAPAASEISNPPSPISSPASPADKPASPGDAPAQPAEPEIETIPAGPVFAFVTHADADAPVNALMARRAFEVGEYLFTSLPQSADDLFERPATPPPSAPSVPAGPAGGISIPVP
jgi:hypothetical protein